jgi:hypothetical protein
MRKPAYLSLFVLSVALVTCTKAEFALIDAVGSGGAGGGAGGVVGPSDDAAPLECETAAVCVSTTGVAVACGDICHASTTGLKPSTGDGCIDRRNDNCGSGNVCLNLGDVSAHCFSLCSTSTDCSDGLACSGRALEGSAGTLVKVCDPKPINCASGECCDPLSTNSFCGNRTCYLVSPLTATSPDSQTVCDNATGSQVGGQSCISSHDCTPPLGCYVPREKLPGGLGTCRSVCRMADADRCGSCYEYGNQYGFCL